MAASQRQLNCNEKRASQSALQASCGADVYGAGGDHQGFSIGSTEFMEDRSAKPCVCTDQPIFLLFLQSAT